MGDGFHFSEPPPNNILDQHYLNSSDFWEVLACVLANLKEGNFSVASVPIYILIRESDELIWSACAYLLGHGAPLTVIKSLVDSFAGKLDDPRQRYVCSVIAKAGSLEYIDHIFVVYLKSSDSTIRRRLEYCLSWLLEVCCLVVAKEVVGIN